MVRVTASESTSGTSATVTVRNETLMKQAVEIHCEGDRVAKCVLAPNQKKEVVVFITTTPRE
jgi:hypothetical protein